MKQLQGIEGLRGIAALSVLFTHVYGWKMGARGVDLFFVVSGVCLAWEPLHAGFDRAKYVMARTCRIIPPYYGAIILGIVVSVTDHRLTLAHALQEGARNLVFWSEWGPLPTINGAFWTIMLEVRWYVYFPFLLWLYNRSKWAFAVLLGAAVLGNCLGPPWMDRETLPAFMAGIIVADVLRRETTFAYLIPLAAGLLGAAVACEITLPPHYTVYSHGNPLWQITLAVTLLAVVQHGGNYFSVTPLRFLGRISYSLYLAQATGLEIFTAVGFSGIPLALVVVAWAYLFHLVFERKSSLWTKIIVGRLKSFGPGKDSEQCLPLPPNASASSDRISSSTIFAEKGRSALLAGPGPARRTRTATS